MSRLRARSNLSLLLFLEERAPGKSKSKRRQVAIKQVRSCSRLLPSLGSMNVTVNAVSH